MDPSLQTTIDRNADELVKTLRLLISEQTRDVDLAVVAAVAGSTIKVTEFGATTAGAALIPVQGVIPAVGDTVLLIRTRTGQTFAVSLGSFAIGTGAGQLPTADAVVLATDVDANVVQRSIQFQDMGVNVTPNPATVDFREGMVAEVGGAQKLNVRVDWGTGSDQVPRGNDARFSDARIPTAHSLGSHSNVATAADSAANGTVLTRSGGQWVAATPTGGSEGAAIADWPRSATEAVSSSTFATYTDSSATVGMTSGRVYSVLVTAIYNVLPASSGSIQIQPFIGASSGGTPSASGANVQALMVVYTNPNFTAPSSSVSFGARFRSTGGTHSLRNGVVSVIAVPK